MEIQTNTDFIKNITQILFLFFTKTNFKNDNLSLKHTLIIDENNEDNRFSQSYYYIKNNFKLYNLNSDSKQNLEKIDKINFKKIYINKIKKSALYNKIERRNILKNLVIKNLYKFLKNLYPEINLTWGCLTFENPLQVSKNMISEGIDPLFIEENLISDYFVDEKNAKLIAKIYNNQKCIIQNDGLINLYIHIPNITQKAIIPQYINALFKEIRAVREIILTKPYVVKSIYISGDAAFVLNLNEFNLLFAETLFSFSEYIVECENFKALDKQKMQVMKNYNINQISLNVKSFSDKTLKTLSKSINFLKNFEIKDFLNLYQSALEFDFEVYLKLTAGLPKENFSTFKDSIKMATEISPNIILINSYKDETTQIDNIFDKDSTSENLNIVEKSEKNCIIVNKMINYMYETLSKENYSPYFVNFKSFPKKIFSLFMNNKKNKTKIDMNINKFKNEVDVQIYKIDFSQINFDVSLNERFTAMGMCKEGKCCIHDVDFNEKAGSIIGCGIGATSFKADFIQNIKKIKNPNNFLLYINEIEKIISEKKELFQI